MDGLGGMFPIVNWPEYPGVSVVRPLLNCDKGSLVEVCRGEGVEWVEDASNKSPLNMRDVIRSLVAEHPEIIPGLTEVVETCADARVHLQSEGTLYTFIVVVGTCMLSGFTSRGRSIAK